MVLNRLLIPEEITMKKFALTLAVCALGISGCGAMRSLGGDSCGCAQKNKASESYKTDKKEGSCSKCGKKKSSCACAECKAYKKSSCSCSKSTKADSPANSCGH